MVQLSLSGLCLAFLLSSSAFSQESTIRSAPASEIAPAPAAEKILVIYYSKTGHTERVANDLATALGADVEKLIDKENRKGFFAWFGSGKDAMKKNLTGIEPQQHDPANYRLVIIGTPVWAGDMTPAVRTWLEGNKSKLQNVAYFCTAGGTKIEKLLPSFEAVTGKKPVAYVGFVHKELKDRKKYEEKLTAFEGQVKGK